MNSIHFCAVLKSLSCVRLFATLWTIALCPWRFSRQESWSGLPCPPPGDLPDPGLSPHLLRPPTLAGGFFTTSATWEAPKALGLSAESFASETGCPLKGQNPAWD